jgi:hypothetical protein
MSTPSKLASLAILQALSNYLDQGGPNASLVFYDDVKPESVNIAVNDSAKLLTLTFPKPCLSSIEADYVELQPLNAGVVVKAGTPIWARLFNAAGDAVVDVDVGDGADITLDNYVFVVGASIKLDAIYLRPI